MPATLAAPHRFRRPFLILASATAISLGSARWIPAQAPKKVLTIDDYARWRSIGSSGISGDGNWVTYYLDLPFAEAKKLREATKPVPRKAQLMELESGRTQVPEVTAPFLIMHGTSDGTVAFQEGLGFYNALRFNGKTATLLAYPGEGHGLRGLANRRELTIRYFQFFDHYLRGKPAARWMTEGVPFLEKELRRDAAKELPPGGIE